MTQLFSEFKGPNQWMGTPCENDSDIGLVLSPYKPNENAKLIRVFFFPESCKYLRFSTLLVM